MKEIRLHHIPLVPVCVRKLDSIWKRKHEMRESFLDDIHHILMMSQTVILTIYGRKLYLFLVSSACQLTTLTIYGHILCTIFGENLLLVSWTLPRSSTPECVTSSLHNHDYSAKYTRQRTVFSSCNLSFSGGSSPTTQWPRDTYNLYCSWSGNGHYTYMCKYRVVRG